VRGQEAPLIQFQSVIMHVLEALLAFKNTLALIPVEPDIYIAVGDLRDLGLIIRVKLLLISRHITHIARK
jgi:hypothetical protein